jgi:hypothetical protein
MASIVKKRITIRFGSFATISRSNNCESFWKASQTEQPEQPLKKRPEVGANHALGVHVELPMRGHIQELLSMMESNSDYRQ